MKCAGRSLVNGEEEFNTNKFKSVGGTHRHKRVIWLTFDYDPQLVIILKKHNKVRWSQSERKWYLTDNKYHRELCGLQPEMVGKEVLNRISEVNLPEFEKYQNLIRLKGYSESTLRTYSLEFAQLLYLLKDFPVQNLSPEKLQSYFLYCIKELKLSENQIHGRINAVKFYFEQVLHKPKLQGLCTHRIFV